MSTVRHHRVGLFFALGLFFILSAVNCFGFAQDGTGNQIAGNGEAENSEAEKNGREESAWKQQFAKRLRLNEDVPRVGLIEPAKSIYEQSQEDDRLIERHLERLEKANKPNPQLLGQTQAAILRVQRNAHRLVLWLEPYGFELGLRQQQMAVRAEKLAKEFLSNPASQPLRTKILRTLRGKKPGILQQVDELIAKQEWFEAEKKNDKALDELHTLSTLLSANERQPIEEPYYRQKLQIESNMDTARRDLAAEVAGRYRDEQLAMYQQAIADSQNAIATIRVNSRITVNGNEVALQDGFAMLAAMWSQAHAGLMRASIVDQAAASRVGKASSKFASGGGAQSVNWATLTSQNSKTMADNMKGIVQADSTRASGDEARDHYYFFVSFLGPIAARFPENTWIDDCQPFLDKLAERGGIQTEVENYAKATDDILAFRERIAKKRMYQRKGSENDLRLTFRTANAFDGSSGVFAPASGVDTQPNMMSPRLEFLPPFSVQENIEGRLQHVRLVNVDSGVTQRVAQMQDGVAFRVADEFEFATAAKTSLLADLMITEQSGALTLATSIASATAFRGDYLEVGAQVQEAVATTALGRALELNDVEAALCAFDDTPFAEARPASCSSLFIDVRVRPTWVLHRYFFAEPVATP